MKIAQDRTSTYVPSSPFSGFDGACCEMLFWRKPKATECLQRVDDEE
jgi:hypothetical protein